MTARTANHSHRQGHFHVGTAGYQYRHWKGRFYPAELPQAEWFDHYAEHFGSVEINNTFYSLPDEATFDAWQEAAPAGFTYTLKFSRYGSHIKRLKSPQQTIPTFLERARCLGTHLGPILVQLPPNWRPQPERLDAFLAEAPGDLRWTIELRDPRWLCDEVFAVLREHGAALCLHDMLEDHPRELTADWSYRRFHGDRYRGRYTPQFLAAEAGRIAELLEAGRDVYAFFNNDEKAYAAHNAEALKRYVVKRL